MVNYILNGQAHGDVAATLLANNFDTGLLRPYIWKDGATYIDKLVQNSEGVWMPKPFMISPPPTANQLVLNTPATLRYEDWKLLDQVIIRVAKERLRAVADLRSSGLTYNIPNGMAKTVLQYEDMSDITDAEIGMDPIRRTEGDRPVNDTKNLPLPVIFKDFSFSARQVMVSRTGGSPLDTTTAELAARRVAEQAEKLLLGVANSYTYGGGTIYGYTNFPSRLTKSMTAPDGTNNDVVVQEVLQMRTQSTDANHYGPWFCYCSTTWDEYMDDDYSSAKGDNTLRDRIGAIDGIDRPVTLDYLPANTLLLVQKSTNVVREVIGMDVQTVRWETRGGMELNFKVMAILVPQVRADQTAQTGIVHGTHS